MQAAALEGVRARQTLVKPQAEARRLGWRDEAVLDLQRVADQRAVEVAPGADAFDHQKVRKGRREVDVRRPLHGAGVEVRRDLRAEAFRDRRDLLRLPDAAGPAERGLQDGRATRAKQRGELGLGRQTLAPGDGDAAGAGDLGHGLDVVGRHRLLEPQGTEPLDRGAKADRAGRGELAVRAKQDVGAVAHRVADGAEHPFGQGDVAQSRLVAAPDRVGAGGIELDRGEAVGDGGGGRLGGHLGAGPERLPVVVRQRVEIGVGAQPLVHLPAEKRPDRAFPRLAKDVPAGDLEAREGADHGRIGALGEACGIGAAEHQLHRLGAFALHVPPEHVADDFCHRRRSHGGGVDLAVARDAAGGDELDDDPVAPAPPRRRGADDEDLERVELHGAPRPKASNRMTFRRDRPVRASSIASLIRSSG